MTEIRIGHNSGRIFVEDEALSLSQQGYEFQFRFQEKLIKRLAGFGTVTLKDMRGNNITIDNFRKKGADGGLDLIIQIEASSMSAAKGVATKVRKIIEELE